MIRVSFGRASAAEGHINARWRFVRLLSDHHKTLAAAILMLAGGFNITSGAYAQTSQEASASCTEKCKADETKCLNDQGSEEMCDYDSKMCKKACGENK